jgi:tetratricopeptide (TPR) repeat protein
MLKKTFLLIFLLFPSIINSVSKEDKVIYAFWDTHSGRYTKMVYIGETVSSDKASILDSNQKIDKDLLQIGLDLRTDTVTVKVINNPGIRVGQTVYLIEKNPDHVSYKEGNVVGQIKVVSIYNTSFFGLQLRGEGYLRLVENKTLTVAMPVETEKPEEALVLKKQGDYYAHKSDVASAISYYKKSIKKDPLYPEAHYALAKIHSASGEGYISAGYEYKLTWQNKNRFQDNEEFFQFHVDYMKHLLNRYEIESYKGKNSQQSLETCLEVGKEALKLSNTNAEVYYSIAYANFLTYLKSNDSVIGSTEEEIKQKIELRKQKENFIISSIENLEKAVKLSPQDYKIHMLAILVYFEKLKDLPVSSSNSQITEGKELKSKIERHGSLYKTYKPKNKKYDKRIKDIIDVVKSFSEN